MAPMFFPFALIGRTGEHPAVFKEPQGEVILSFLEILPGFVEPLRISMVQQATQVVEPFPVLGAPGFRKFALLKLSRNFKGASFGAQ